MVTDAEGNTQSVGVVVRPNVTIRVVDVVPPSCPSCADGSITVAAEGESPPFTYRWSNDQTTATAVGLAPGSYSVRATNSRGCWTDLEVELATAPRPTLQVLAGLKAGCDRFSGYATQARFCVVGGTAPLTFFYDGPPHPQLCPLDPDGRPPDPEDCPELEPLIVPVGVDPCVAPARSQGLAVGFTPGTYDFRVADALGATALEQEVDIEAILTIGFEVERPSCETCADGSITSRVRGKAPPFRYRWWYEDQILPQTTATISDLLPGTYRVEVTNHAGCHLVESIVLTPASAPDGRSTR